MKPVLSSSIWLPECTVLTSRTEEPNHRIGSLPEIIDNLLKQLKKMAT